MKELGRVTKQGAGGRGERPFSPSSQIFQLPPIQYGNWNVTRPRSPTRPIWQPKYKINACKQASPCLVEGLGQAHLKYFLQFSFKWLYLAHFRGKLSPSFLGPIHVALEKYLWNQQFQSNSSNPLKYIILMQNYRFLSWSTHFLQKNSEFCGESVELLQTPSCL